MFQCNYKDIYLVKKNQNTIKEETLISNKRFIFCPTLTEKFNINLFTGAFQWEELEEDIRKKLKDSGDVSNVIEKVKCILKTPGKVSQFIVSYFTLTFSEL